MTTTDRPLTLAELADELCDSRQHTERIPYWDDNRNRKHRTHRVVLPGLLQQMADLFPPINEPGDAGARHPASKPPVRWDALAEHTQIAAYSARWCWDLHLDLRDTVEGNIRALVGASGNLDTDTRDRLAADVRRWHRWAETVTGWTSPPIDIRAPCPATTARDSQPTTCGRRTLRVNLAASEGYCGTCGAYWDAEHLPALGDAVRAYRDRAAADAHHARQQARARHAEPAA